MTLATADLCDAHGDAVRVLTPAFTDIGGLSRFSGLVVTIRVRRDNALVRTVLSEPGQGRVLVVDGGGLTDCALVGGRLGALAAENGWSGIVVWGAVRDRTELAAVDLGVRALATSPRPPQKRGDGQRDLPVEVAGVTVTTGDWLAADADGIIVSARDLSPPAVQA